MKKFIVGIGLLLMSAIILSGCSNGASGGGDETVLEWTSHPVYSLKSPNQEVVDYLKGSIEEFEKSHEGMTIENNAMSTNNQEAMAKLLEQASQDRAPAIAQIDSYILPRFHDTLQPIGKQLEKHGIKIDDFFPFAQEVMSNDDGEVVGAQFTTDVRVLFYRKDLIDTPPETWADVMKVSEKMKAEGLVPFLTPGGRGEGTTMTTILPAFWSQGGKLVDEEGNPIFGEGENREYMLNVFNYLNDLVEKGYLPKRVSSYGSESDLNQEIASGNVAMFLGGNWQVNQLKSILGEEKFKERWGIASIPYKEGGTPTTAAGGWSWGVFTDDEKEKEAAVDFLVNTFVGDEGMATWSTIGGYLPTRKSVYESEKYEKTAYSETFKTMLEEEAKKRPSSKQYSDISTQLQIAVSNVISGNKEPEQALEDAWSVVK